MKYRIDLAKFARVLCVFHSQLVKSKLMASNYCIALTQKKLVVSITCIFTGDYLKSNERIISITNSPVYLFNLEPLFCACGTV